MLLTVLAIASALTMTTGVDSDGELRKLAAVAEMETRPNVMKRPQYAAVDAVYEERYRRRLRERRDLAKRAVEDRDNKRPRVFDPMRAFVNRHTRNKKAPSFF